MADSKKYHMGDNGKPMTCVAENACPKGGSLGHGSFEKVQAYCDKYNEAVYEMKEEELIEKAKDNSRESDVYRTALYDRANKDKKPIHRSYKDLKFSEFSEPNSGITMNINNDELVQSGFCVSPYPDQSLAIESDLTDEEFQKALDDYIEKNKEILDQPNHYVGLWKSPYDGALYVDISVVYEDAAYTRDVGEEKDQQGYFDMQTYEEITIDPNATSGQGEKDAA